MVDQELSTEKALTLSKMFAYTRTLRGDNLEGAASRMGLPIQRLKDLRKLGWREIPLSLVPTFAGYMNYRPDSLVNTIDTINESQELTQKGLGENIVDIPIINNLTLSDKFHIAFTMDNGHPEETKAKLAVGYIRSDYCDLDPRDDLPRLRVSLPIADHNRLSATGKLRVVEGMVTLPFSVVSKHLSYYI